MIKVKPLIWDDDSNNFGRYCIENNCWDDDEKDPYSVNEFGYGSEIWKSLPLKFRTEEEAKAWVQKQHDEHILSLIEVQG